MAEYIEREALITKFKKMDLGEQGLVERLFADGVYAVIAAFPAADVAPVLHGRWINIKRFNDGERIIATCSYCKDRGDVRTIRTELGLWELDSPYCPNCGAKMDGGTQNV